MADSGQERRADGVARHPVDADRPSVQSPQTPQVERSVVNRLASHRTLGGAPTRELEWLAAHGCLERRAIGALVAERTKPIPGMFIIFSGRLAIYLDRAGVAHKELEWRGGDVTGVLPYSRVVNAPGNTIVEEALEMLVIPRDQLQEMVRQCHEVTSLLVHVMLDRTRFFTASQLHDEQLKSLGRLAAGLAHELNNPAAAITRFAKLLPAAVDAAESASEAIARAGLTPDEREAVGRLLADTEAAPMHQVRSPIEEAEREEEITAWLERHGIEADAAEMVAQAPVTLPGLDGFASRLRREALEPALRWAAADFSIRTLAAGIDNAGTRISDLVTAVRGFSRVDTAAVPEPVDVGKGLMQTLTVLRGKARDKAIRVAVELEPGLPFVHGIAAALNQVWSNLVDNALDAAPRGGNVHVSARRRGDSVAVGVTDDGAGIDAAVRHRIFEPFFTTKDVGQGTGLGLDIVRRLVAQHDGDIDVASEPGRTTFTVTLPITGRQQSNERQP